MSETHCPGTDKRIILNLKKWESHQESFETAAPEQVGDLKRLSPVQYPNECTPAKQNKRASGNEQTEASMAVGLLADRTTLRAQKFQLGLTQGQDCRLCRGTYCVSVFSTGMRMIQNFEAYVIEDQGSRKQEGEWPKTPGRHQQAWYNTVTLF